MLDSCKKKIITVRLSEAEHQILKRLYPGYGASSLSDLVRLALQCLMNGPSDQQYGLAMKLADLDGRVHALESQFTLLADREKAVS